MKKIIVVAGILFISGCATTAMPNYFNGNYYMAGDDTCRQVRPLSATRVMCMDASGRETGYRDAMTVEQMQMYQMSQQQAQSQQSQQPRSKTVNCRKIGDLSGQIFQFSGGYCPVGYY